MFKALYAVVHTVHYVILNINVLLYYCQYTPCVTSAFSTYNFICTVGMQISETLILGLYLIPLHNLGCKAFLKRFYVKNTQGKLTCTWGGGVSPQAKAFVTSQQ